MRSEVKPPQELVDEHTLLAQKYCGYLVGYHYQNPQLTSTVEVDTSRPWREPPIIQDDCIFCQRLTDAEAERRVLGFQYQLDKEVLRLKRRYFNAWLYPNGKVEADPEPEKLREFCELFQDMPTERRPTGWRTKPFPIYKLPIRLKRKLCIEWNHGYMAWLTSNPNVYYDFDQKQFYQEIVPI